MILIEDSSLYDKVYWIDKKYRCSHCLISYCVYPKILKHETECESNPENKNCITCDSNCDVQPPDGFGCKRWKNLKFERTKKLTLLINKIKIHGI